MAEREYTVEETLKAAVLLMAVTYSLGVISWANRPKEEIEHLTDQWANDEVQNVIRYLDKWGFTIVKKEPALLNYPA